MDNNKTDKLKEIKDYLKAEIYEELKNEIRKEVADEFEQRFISVLDMHIQQVLLHHVCVELDITEMGINSRLILGYQSGKPVFNAYHYKLQELINNVTP